MSVTAKTLGALVIALLGLVAYVSTHAFGIYVLFYYALPATFAMLGLIIYFSAVAPAEE